MTANLNREQQKLYESCFLNVSFALYLESQNVLEQLAVWIFFLYACSIMQMVQI